MKRYIQSCIVPSAIRTNQHNNANKELIDTNIHTRLKLFPSCWMNTHTYPLCWGFGTFFCRLTLVGPWIYHSIHNRNWSRVIMVYRPLIVCIVLNYWNCKNFVTFVYLTMPWRLLLPIFLHTSMSFKVFSR